MPSVCSAAGCNNKIGKENGEWRFFRFPKNEAYMKQWIDVCNKKNINVKNARICSIHFRAECYKPVSYVDEVLQTYKTTKRTLRDDAVPTENLLLPVKDVPECQQVDFSDLKDAFETTGTSSLDNTDVFSSLQNSLNDIYWKFHDPEHREDLKRELETLKKEFDTEIKNEMKDENFCEMLFAELEKSKEEWNKSKEELNKSKEELNKSREDFNKSQEKLRETEEKLKSSKEEVANLKLTLKERAEEYLKDILERKVKEAYWKRGFHCYKHRPFFTF